jgi:hypothetical protein
MKISKNTKYFRNQNKHSSFYTFFFHEISQFLKETTLQKLMSTSSFAILHSVSEALLNISMLIVKATFKHKFTF